MDELSKRPSLSGFKFFSEEEDTEAIKGKVQIMTLHKSKGDEFDYVFLPELTEKSLSIDTELASVKAPTLFMEDVRSLNLNYKPKSLLELKQFNCEESLRLLYVAITKAKNIHSLYPIICYNSLVNQYSCPNSSICFIFSKILLL